MISLQPLLLKLMEWRQITKHTHARTQALTLNSSRAIWNSKQEDVTLSQLKLRNLSSAYIHQHTSRTPSLLFSIVNKMIELPKPTYSTPIIHSTNRNGFWRKFAIAAESMIWETVMPNPYTLQVLCWAEIGRNSITLFFYSFESLTHDKSVRFPGWIREALQR